MVKDFSFLSSIIISGWCVGFILNSYVFQKTFKLKPEAHLACALKSVIAFVAIL